MIPLPLIAGAFLFALGCIALVLVLTGKNDLHDDVIASAIPETELSKVDVEADHLIPEAVSYPMPEVVTKLPRNPKKTSVKTVAVKKTAAKKTARNKSLTK